MSHKTLISGTAYEVVGGAQMIDGTKFQMGGGKTILGGTGYDIPFSKGIPLSTITPGAILYLNESGSPVPFYIAKHDYESGLNGTGRTLVVRKGWYSKSGIFSNISNSYEDGSLDWALNYTYKGKLDENIQGILGPTSIKYTNADKELSTMQRYVFQLSITELCGAVTNSNAEGSMLPIASTLFVNYDTSGSYPVQWTRSPVISGNRYVFAVGAPTGAVFNGYLYNDTGNYSRPAFTLPATTAVTPNADGTYTLAA